MKYLSVMALLTTFLFLAACDDTEVEEATSEPTAASEEVEEAEQAAEVELASSTLAIEGMTCVSCARGIESALSDAEGVHTVNVDFGARTAQVDYDPALLDEAGLIELVDEAGFGATPYHPEEAIEG